MKVCFFEYSCERFPLIISSYNSSILLKIYQSINSTAINILLKVMIARHKELCDATIIFNILDLIFTLEKV